MSYAIHFFVSDNNVRLNVCKLEAIIDLLGGPTDPLNYGLA
jgi:hypothetical protein